MAQSNRCAPRDRNRNRAWGYGSSEADEKSEQRTVESANDIVEYPNATLYRVGNSEVAGWPVAALKHLLK